MFGNLPIGGCTCPISRTSCLNHLPSELNPLTNPVLERNLGRWAQVYFSTPPAKRQQAVSKLLEKIQRETGAQPAEKTIRPNFVRDEKFHTALCSACQHQNPPGHRFCSRCGHTLHPVQPDAADHQGAREVGEAAPPPSENNDVQWLRDRAFSGLDGSDGPQGLAWKYLLGAVVLVLAGFAYLQWAQRPRVGATSSSNTAPAGECPGSFASARFFAGRIQSTRSDFGGAQNARDPGLGDHRGP